MSLDLLVHTQEITTGVTEMQITCILRHVLDGLGIKGALNPRKRLHDALSQSQGPTCTLASSAKHRNARYGYACQDGTVRT